MDFSLVVTSLVVEHRILGTWVSAARIVCSVVVVYGLSPPRMWNLPRPEIEPMSSALAGEFFTTGPPGKSWSSFYVQSSPLWQSVEGFEVLCPPWTPSSVSLRKRLNSILDTVSWNFSLGHNLGQFRGLFQLTILLQWSRSCWQLFNLQTIFLGF